MVWLAASGIKAGGNGSPNRPPFLLSLKIAQLWLSGLFLPSPIFLVNEQGLPGGSAGARVGQI